METSSWSSHPRFSPAAEARRQAAIDGLQIDALLRSALTQLTHQAARAFDVPMAAITLLGRDRQVFEARVGIDLESTPRDVALCNWSILTPGEVTVIEDTLADPRVSSNPLVQGPPRLRFYAGVPLTLGTVTIGALCVLDTQPRRSTPGQLHALRSLAYDVVLNLDARFFRRGAMPRPEPIIEPVADVPPRGRILAVGDSEVALRSLVSQLEIAGFSVSGVDCKDAVLAAPEIEVFDAVVLGMRVAGTDGVSFVRALRANLLTRSMPIALYSSQDEDEVSALSADCDLVLKEPIQSVELGLALDRLIRKR